jgi:hypothetical protein
MDTFVEMYIQFAGWVAKLAALLLATGSLHSSLDSNPDISQKYKMGDISKGLANTL